MVSIGILILALVLAGWVFSAPWPMLAFFLASMAFILVVQLAIVARCMRSSSRWVGYATEHAVLLVEATRRHWLIREHFAWPIGRGHGEELRDIVLPLLRESATANGVPVRAEVISRRVLGRYRGALAGVELHRAWRPLPLWVATWVPPRRTDPASSR